jgi:hypothetical protein
MASSSDNLLLERNLNLVFNERDTLRRQQAIQSLFSEHAVFYEGAEQFQGWAAIAARFDEILSPTPPEFTFTRVKPGGRIQDLEQLLWQLGPAHAPPVASGLDVAIIEDGRIKILYTFVDPAA